MKKSKDSLHIGDIIIYNGYVPEYVDEREKNAIKKFLYRAESYIILDIDIFDDGTWYQLLPFPYCIWIPKESFYIKRDMNKLYGLK